jgi:hypothetical protein
LFLLPAKLAINYINIFTFFENLKETFQFGLLVAMSRALSLPPSAPSTRSEVGGGRDMASPIFPF